MKLRDADTNHVIAQNFSAYCLLKYARNNHTNTALITNKFFLVSILMTIL